MKKNLLYLIQAAIIAAIYVIITLTFSPLSFGPVQFRFSEALTVLPFVLKSAVPGLFVGCLIANFFSPNPLMWMDVVFGSLATLLAAYLTMKTKKPYLAPLPPVIVNALIIGIMLAYLYGLPLWLTISSVGLGQAVSCYVLGYPLLFFLLKTKIFQR
ncbi:MAG TPA: QueT transporter family protein [Clostridia bacterium]|nr:QueT transporter family protein [Clostridia bacterium]